MTWPLARSPEIVAIPAAHPRLAAVLRTHARVQRVRAARTACLYVAALGGGIAWLCEFGPRAAPLWASALARVGCPIAIGLLAALVVLEWMGKARLERLLADDGASLE